jgi:hypothetical protein
MQLTAPALGQCAPGDIDNNGLVDLTDAALLINCLTGPGSTAGDGCDQASLDDDPDIDVQDYATLQGVFGLHAPLFLNRHLRAAANGPRDTELVDLDLDGDLDLVIAYQFQSDIGVRFNLGYGRFSEETLYDVFGGQLDVTVMDFDMDGALDIGVVAGDTISILTNIGDGTFMPAIHYETVSDSSRVVAGDLDGDGDLDLVANNDVSLSLIYRDASGGVDDHVVIVTDQHPRGVAVGDLDGDGSPEIVTKNHFNEGTVTVLWNVDGGFDRVDLDAGNGWEVYLHDLDGDDDLDMATGGGLLNVLRNYGEEAFGHADYGLGGSRVGGFHDFDSDGDVDIVMTQFSSERFNVMINNGNASFNTFTRYAAGGGTFGASAGDVDGDGDGDIAFANQKPDTITVVRNNGDGTFEHNPAYNIGGFSPGSLVLGDFDTDDTLDVATTAINQFDQISVMRGLGNGVFTEGTAWSLNTRQDAIEQADFDNDGDIDLVTANGITGTIAVLRNTGSAVFDDVDYYSVPEPVSITTADFTGDDFTDVVTVNGTSGELTLTVNNGAGQLFTDIALPFDTPVVMVVSADFNADGMQDLAVSSEVESRVSVLVNDGEGNFALADEVVVANGPTNIAVADIDGIAGPDLISYSPSSETITVLLNDGSADFAASTEVQTALEGDGVIGPGDFDGDGDIDIAVGIDYSSVLFVTLNDGDGSFDAGEVYTTGAEPSDIAAVDFNGDGADDLIVAGYASANVTVHISRCVP